MLLTVHQEDPDENNDHQKDADDVSEDELDMILATMGTTSLKESEMALLQDDIEHEESIQEENAEVEPTEVQPVESKQSKKKSARSAVKRFINKLKRVK